MKMNWRNGSERHKTRRVTEPGKPANFSIAERYTEDTRRAIQQAKFEAQARGSAVITAADLLAGLSADDATRAVRVGLLKENAFYLRWLTGLPSLPAAEPGPHACSLESIEMDQEAKRAIACAVAEADRDREYWIDSDHLLRGLLCFPNSADFALLKTELSLDSARLQSRRDREEFLPENNPSLKVVEYLVRKHLTLWGPPLVSLACYLYILMQTVGFNFPRLAH